MSNTTRYWQVTFLTENGRNRRVWATNYNDPGAGRNIRFWVVDKEGNEPEPRELVIVAPEDLRRLRAAAMNNKYAELEASVTQNYLVSDAS
jgi:hypothetical protein